MASSTATWTGSAIRLRGRYIGMRITRNPFQRAAAGCALLALVASLTAYPPVAVPLLMVGLALAVRAR
jgi:hypothetical protein